MHYGIDNQGPIQSCYSGTNETAKVEVPRICCPFNNDQLRLIKNRFDPRQESTNYGVDIYLNLLNYVNEMF